MSKLTDARTAVGGLSKPSKMPGMAYSTPAKACKTGSKLAARPGTVCSDCYALKGMYRFKTVQTALYRRLESIDQPLWAANMAVAINKQEFFRWHDSGDIQNLSHLEKICSVAVMTPETKHWLPTREKSIVRAFIRKHGAFPLNLVVRLSATMVDGAAPAGFNHTSTVHTEKAIGHECPAPKQDNQCGDCRACWQPAISNISYHKH